MIITEASRAALLEELYQELKGCQWIRQDGEENKLAITMSNLERISKDPEIRALNLEWKDNECGGKVHQEWTAPCGCAYHPEPDPHVHKCEEHVWKSWCAV